MIAVDHRGLGDRFPDNARGVQPLSTRSIMMETPSDRGDFPRSRTIVHEIALNFAHLRGCLQTKCGRTDSVQRPILKPHLSNQCSTTRKTAPPPWQPYIYKTNLFTKCHDDWAKNVTSRDHVIQLTRTIFQLNSRIKETNVVTKFHENWAKNVTSRDIFENLTAKCDGKTDRQTDGRTETNALTKFHEYWAKNVTSRVLTCFHYIHIEKNAPPTGGHVFSPIWTIFELVQEINNTNVLTNFHDDWTKIVTSRVFTRKTAPPTGGHVFQRTGTTFELNQHIIKTNFLTKIHDLGMKCDFYSVYNFKLDRDFIWTKLLTKFHEDRTINVASRVDGRTYDGQRPVTNAYLSNQYSVRAIVVCQYESNLIIKLIRKLWLF
ncbi:hypothetical protein DPMN_126813 [Dreissena polymorpha]|uniref:Uncharacterized protein n=1 Tax=Dreissena polymorpha TaxID=45954 RepID=A0A9D4H033_DREPO|nr:hypothetical protein DPMN_126813 [Dreissena polymorpha]